MVPESQQLKALATRVRKQAEALAESESLAMQNMQYAADLEQQLNACRTHVSQYEQQVSELETFRAQAETLREREKQLSNLQIDCARAKEEAQSLREQLNSTTHARDEVRQQMEFVQHQLREVKQEMEQRPLLAEFNAIRAERDGLHQQLQQRPQWEQWEDLQHQLEAVQHQLSQRPSHEQWGDLQQSLQSLRMENEAQRHQLEQVPSSNQLQALHHQLETLLAERDALQQQLESAIAERDLLQQQLDGLPSREQWDDLQHQLEALRTENAAARQQMEQLPAVQLDDWQRQLDALRDERDALQQELANRPNRETIAHWQQAIEQQPAAEAIQEARRRQELAEAHHLVIKKQYEALQRRVTELEEECRQSQVYAQSQEKDVSGLEDTKQQLELKLAALQQQNTRLNDLLQKLQASPQPQSVEPALAADEDIPVAATLAPDFAPLQVATPEETIANPLPETTFTPKVGRQRPSIPPLFGREAPLVGSTPTRFDHRVRTLAAASAESVSARSKTTPVISTPARQRDGIDLPAFVRRRSVG
jgi:chromosome segregation ATPase